MTYNVFGGMLNLAQLQLHCEQNTNGTNNKMLCYHRETVLQDALVLAKSGRLELGDNIVRTL